jgi:hypothetical protein
MTDHRLLTPDELAAIRDYITGWEPARDRRFLEAARTLLDHADAQDAELARLRELRWRQFARKRPEPVTRTTLSISAPSVASVTVCQRPAHDCPRPDCPVAAARALLDGGA